MRTDRDADAGRSGGSEHPWAMYAVVGMIVAYFNYRRDEPGLISPVFRS